MPLGSRIRICSEQDSYPPHGAEGSISVLWGCFVFIPDNVAHFPPDCPPDEFGGYGLAGLKFELMRNSPCRDRELIT